MLNNLYNENDFAHLNIEQCQHQTYLTEEQESDICLSVREAFTIKTCRNLGKVPNRGGGSSKIQKVPKFQLGKVQKEGGHQISKKSQVSKSSQV